MKFELTNMRMRISDIEYINDLRTVASNLGKNSLKQRDYSKKNGAKFNVNSAIKRFGGWDATLKKAGLEGERSLKGMEYGDKKIKDGILLSDLIRVAHELNNPNITISDYANRGKYTAFTMHARFGSWNKAKQKANLIVSHVVNTTNEELFQNLLDIWTLLGQQPKYGEVVAPNSKFHGATYARRFGSWRCALETFIEYANSENSVEDIPNADVDLVPLNTSRQNQTGAQKEIKTKRTTRGVNLRLRWTILQRDKFSCKKCGRSPSKDQNVILHVDHIIPWSKDGETVIENLETLCEQCNLGKSNLT
jgi:hypothetical protein